MRSDIHMIEGEGANHSTIFQTSTREGPETFLPVTSASVPDLRERIVRHCSPTLAGLKCGSMFRVESGLHDIQDQIHQLRSLLGPRGVDVAILRIEDDAVLLYIYRPLKLDERLSSEGVRDFLSLYGYGDGGARAMVSQLTERFVNCPSMPPEVGIFLDYPLEDVRGYIENQGRCCRCIGCWKVYGDVEAAERRFTSYKKCRDVYTRRYNEGHCISRLAIKA